MLRTITATEEYNQTPQPLILRIAAKVVSYVFHPLFIPIYVTLVVLWLHPLNALVLGYRQRVLMTVAIFMSTAFFPAIAIFLMWRLKFIENIYIRQQKERIIPYVVTMFFYFWIYYVSRNLEFFPQDLRQFLMGVFLSAASALFANIYTKISMHGIAVGGIAGFAILQQLDDTHWLPLWTHIGILIAGTVCTARLILEEHKPVDVYAGFFTGFLCQVVAYLIV
ncbi:MAG: hypothetical protein EOO61_06490 [Hymenobacter sp.]|nr:MAG: hypothetical protein EOO61_06490 [Hymenobacter sp.]